MTPTIVAEPATVARASRALHEVAAALGQAIARLAGMPVDGIWEGLAATRFEALRHRLERGGRACVDELSAVATVLSGYAAVLADLAAEGERADHQVAAARRAIDRARAGVQLQRDFEDRARLDADEWNRANPLLPRLPDEWPGPDWHRRLADAQRDLELGHRAQDAALDALDRAAAQTAARLEAVADGGGVAGWLADLRARVGLIDPPRSFVVGTQGLIANDVASWRQQALDAAGIDPSRWDPRLGVAANHHTIAAVYDYYGRLHACDPRLQWAGLAALVGGTFFAGFQDLAVLRRVVASGQRVADLIDDLPLDPATAAALRGVDHLDEITVDDLAYVERRFLDMQRQIFDDMAPAHQAYLVGGIAALRQIRDLDADLLRAFEVLDAGDAQRAAQLLAWREQRRIIQDDYDELWDRSAIIQALLTITSITARSPVPGGRAFVRQHGVKVDVGLDDPDLDLGDARHRWIDVLPTGPGLPPVGWLRRLAGVDVDVDVIPNVADFDDRWSWFEDDVFDPFAALTPRQLAALLADPVTVRAQQRRLLPDLPGLGYQPVDADQERAPISRWPATTARA